jgi:hypothetical protein
MKIRSALLLSLLACATAAVAAAGPSIVNDKRDLTAGSIAGAYYMIHRATALCVEKKVHDAAWRDALLAPWRERHRAYLLGTRGYMNRRGQEEEDKSGAAARKATEAALLKAFKESLAGGEVALFKDHPAEQSCSNIETLIKQGDWDLQVIVTSKNSGGEVDLEDLSRAGAPFATGDNLEPMPFPVLP